jgi:hypothetical protein
MMLEGWGRSWSEERVRGSRRGSWRNVDLSYFELFSINSFHLQLHLCLHRWIFAWRPGTSGLEVPLGMNK